MNGVRKMVGICVSPSMQAARAPTAVCLRSGLKLQTLSSDLPNIGMG